jgi:NhaP-type Na+/H+ and K+/H+ antiporter
LDIIEKQDLYEAVWEKKGAVHQVNKFMEEMSELSKELFKAQKHNGDRTVDQTINDKVLEEFADVTICMEQVRMKLMQLKTNSGESAYAVMLQHKEKKLERLKRTFTTDGNL